MSTIDKVVFERSSAWRSLSPSVRSLSPLSPPLCVTMGEKGFIVHIVSIESMRKVDAVIIISKISRLCIYLLLSLRANNQIHNRCRIYFNVLNFFVLIRGSSLCLMLTLSNIQPIKEAAVVERTVTSSHLSALPID